MFSLIEAEPKGLYRSPDERGGGGKDSLKAIGEETSRVIRDVRRLLEEGDLFGASDLYNAEMKRINDLIADPANVSIVARLRGLKALLQRQLGNEVVGDGEEEAEEEKSEFTPLKEITPQEKLENLWAEIIVTDRPTKGNTTPFNQEKAAEIRKIATTIGREALAEWDVKIKLWDAFIVGAKADILKQLSWLNVIESRKSVAGEINITELREFYTRHKPIVDKISEIMLNGPYCFVDDSGKPLKRMNGTEIVSHDGAVLTFDYAREGNPGDYDKTKGVPSLGELIKILYPHLTSSDADAIIFFTVIGELRAKAWVPYHANYVTSPKGTHDVTALKMSAPMAIILYNIRKAKLIPPNLRFFWQTQLLPDYYPDGTSSFVFAGSNNERGQRYVGDTSNPSRENGNVVEAIKVRKQMDNMVSSDIDKARLDSSLATFPFLWDFITDYEANTGYLKATLEEYYLGCESWLKFLDLIAKPPKISSENDLFEAVSDIVGMFSPVKGLYAIIPESRYKTIFEETVKILFLRYTRYLFDQYEKISKLPHATLRAVRFANTVAQLYDQMGTLPGFVKKYMGEVMNAVKSSFGGNVKFRRIFSPTKEWSSFEIAGWQAPVPVGVITRFDDTFKQYMRIPSATEKKET